MARLASVLRCAGVAYIAVQVAIWHQFYTSDSWRFAGPVAVTAWAAAVTVYLLRRGWPAAHFACVDTAIYMAFALGAEGCVPPAIRGAAFSWLVISMSSQLIVPAWYAPVRCSVPMALASPVAFLVGAEFMAHTDIRTMTAAAILLIMVGGINIYGRRELYGRAAAADAALDEADRAAGEQYVILSRTIERREQERLLHDTVLNTLTALARADGDDVAGVVTRCRQDVALIAGALGDPGDRDADAECPYRDVVGGVRAVAAEMRTRGLNVHVEVAEDGAPAVPAPIASAISNAAREALSNVAAHAGTAEAWVEVSLTKTDENAEPPCRLRVTVRDSGIGFDLARVDRARLGLRRSIVERTADCGGQASIWSAPGRGTLVQLSWPAPAEPAQAALAGRLLPGESPSW